jgi:hypothetical protein
MQLALKIDVDSERGARLGVPALQAWLAEMDVRATFFWSMGPDRLRARYRRLPKSQRWLGPTGLARLYGRGWPAPDIARCAPTFMPALIAAGHECGIGVWAPAEWSAGGASRSPDAIDAMLDRLLARFAEWAGTPALAMATPGFQSDRRLARRAQQLGLRYLSDCQGQTPFWPVYDAEPVRCPQWPTTLPMLDALLRGEGLTLEDTFSRLIALAARAQTAHQVLTLRAEWAVPSVLDGLRGVLEAWRAQGWQISPLGDLAAGFEPLGLRAHRVVVDAAGARQGDPFP